MSFDPLFRPKSYFSELTAEQLVLSSISGEERRRAAAAQLKAGLIPQEIDTDSNLSDEARRARGSVHPALMGGEYLPPLRQNEIEIARIVLASVTQDVLSIRAGYDGQKIVYRIATEYEDQDMGGVNCYIKSSAQTLTQGEVVELIQKSTFAAESDELKPYGLVFSTLRSNLDNGADPEDMKIFIDVESEFYPDLGTYFREAVEKFVDDWVAERTSE